MSKPDETITISIDPESLDYSLECKNTYIEDIYIVLREIILSLESGDLQGVFKLEDADGEPATNEQVRSVIQQLKGKIDQAVEGKESPFNMVGDFRN